jgi:putative oxidoreductase
MNTSLDDLGKLILRFSVGGMLLLHGLWKLTNGVSFVQQQVEKAGLPAFISYGVYVGEIVAPILLFAGILTRPAGLIIALDLAGAIFLARRNDIATLGGGGGWAIEVEMMFLLGGLAIACLGAGRLALGKPSRWN